MRTNQIRLIEQMVVKFRQDVGLGNTDAINLKSLLLKLKVVSIFRPLSDDFCGMSLKDSSSHRFMLINSNHSKGRQHFTIAHELFHLFIEENPKPHKCTLSNGSKNPIEQQANMFASEFPVTAIKASVSLILSSCRNSELRPSSWKTVTFLGSFCNN